MPLTRQQHIESYRRYYGEERRTTLSEAQQRVLDALKTLGPSTAVEIANHTGGHHCGVGNTAARLRDKGYVERLADTPEKGKVTWRAYDN